MKSILSSISICHNYGNIRYSPHSLRRPNGLGLPLVSSLSLPPSRTIFPSLQVTQPRRISAISVAERIADERAERVGQTAGYHIRLEVKRSAETRILLLTTGVLLRMLQVMICS